jgi:hypothetical protein
MRRFGIAAVGLVLATSAWASGCKTNDCLSETCRNELRADNPAGGSYVTTPSFDRARDTGKLVVDDYGDPVLHDGKLVYTRIPTKRAAATSLGTACENVVGPCVMVHVSPSVAVIFALPRKPGHYRLGDLGAYTMEPYPPGTTAETRIDPVRGEVTVRDVEAPCGAGGCGRLDGELTIDPLPLGDGPHVEGSGPLRYREWTTEICDSPACVEPDVRGGFGPH